MAKTLLFETAFVTVTFVAPGVLTVRGSGDWAFGIEGNVDWGCYLFRLKIYLVSNLYLRDSVLNTNYIYSTVLGD